MHSSNVTCCSTLEGGDSDESSLASELLAAHVISEAQYDELVHTKVKGTDKTAEELMEEKATGKMEAMAESLAEQVAKSGGAGEELGALGSRLREETRAMGEAQRELKTQLLMSGPEASPVLKAIGMGGCGKTCMVSRVVSDTEVRQAYQRIVWVNIGLESTSVQLQGSLYKQLTGAFLHEKELYIVLEWAGKGDLKSLISEYRRRQGARPGGSLQFASESRRMNRR